jgi:hypothetical protein
METALALRRRLAGPARDRLHAVLERVFDEACMGDEVVHVGRLDLSVRVDPKDEALDSLEGAIVTQVAELLRPGAGRADLRQAGRPRRASTPERSRFEILVTYLESGALPWQVADLESRALLEQLRDTASRQLLVLADLAKRRVDRAPRGRPFLFRLLQLVPEDQWVVVARHLAMESGRAQVEDLLRAVAGLADDAGSIGRHQRIDLAAWMITRRRGREGERPDAEPTVLSTADLPEPVATYFARWLDPATSRSQGRGRSTAGQGPRTPGAGSARAAPPSQDAPVLEISAAPAAAPEDLTEVAEKAAEFGWPVSHAGLILLHPFLPAFFAKTAIRTPAESRLPPENLARAAALLHFLATGLEEGHEFDLGFIKILLGEGPEEPLPVSGGLLLPSDREEAGALLSSVLGHWSALKATSVDGLRASFLRRRGLVREERWSWRLRVPAEPFDVLLNQLPWGIGIARLPWMTRAIETEWQTP